MYIRDNTAPGTEDLVDYLEQTYVNVPFRRAGVLLDSLE